MAPAARVVFGFVFVFGRKREYEYEHEDDCHSTHPTPNLC